MVPNPKYERIFYLGTVRDSATAMDTPFLTNRKLDEKQIQTLLELADKDDPILFAVVGEITNSAKYSLHVLLVTATHLFSYDFGTGE